MTLDNALNSLKERLNGKKLDWVILVNEFNDPVATVKVPDDLPLWKIYPHLSNHEMIIPFLKSIVTEIRGENDKRTDIYMCKIHIIARE